MGKPYVSVLIDTYNHERFIEQAITSVLEQDFPANDREVIVIDDGSTDRTGEIVRKFMPSVCYIYKQNGGQASAFNAGIPECRGELVSFLDGDDWWTPRKLSRVIPVLAADSEIGMVGHGNITMLPDGREFTEVVREGNRLSLRTPEGARLFRARKSSLGTRTTIRANILKKLLPVPEAIRIEADEFVFTMAAALGDVQILGEALFHYRLHPNNFYSQHGFDRSAVSRKQQYIAQLARSLRERLTDIGTSAEVVDIVVESVQVEADQLRLTVERGWPWETVKTELAMYRLLHEDAPWTHRLFKRAVLLPACFVPSRVYYGAQRWLVRSDWYKNLRTVIFPVPQPGHLGRSWKSPT